MSVTTKTKTKYFVQTGEVVLSDADWEEYKEWGGYEHTEEGGDRLIWSRYGAEHETEDEALTTAGKALKTYLHVRVKATTETITHTFS